MGKFCDRGHAELAALPPETAAYLAGLFDGEGCVYIAVRAKKYLELGATVASTCIPFLRAIYAEAGSPGSISVRERKGNVLGKKPIGAWHMTGRTAVAFLLAIQPWVRMKRENISVALRFYRLRHHGGGKKSMPIIQSAMQTMLAQQLRTLNGQTGRSKPLKFNPLAYRTPNAVH